MADEQNKTDEVLNKDTQTEKTSTPPELAPEEVRALEQGWKPLDQWEGDPADWRDAKSFLDRGELLNRISGQSKEIKELRKAMREMTEHNRKLAEVEYQRALSDLKQQKLEALENNEAARVVDLDEQIDSTKEKLAAAKAEGERRVAEATDGPHPAMQAWIERNSWYAQNNKMRAYADAAGLEYAQQNPGVPPDAVLKYVENEVKKEFPHKFSNMKREMPSAVEGASTRTASARRTGSDKDDVTLSDDERRVMERLVRDGHMTKEKYLEDIKKIRLIK